MAGPSIIHIALQEASPGEAARIVAQLRDPSGVFSPVVHHRMDGALEFSSVDMTSVDDVHYAATIPGALVTGSFHYYIEAYDDVGNGPSLAGTEASPLFVRSDAPLPDAAVDSPRLPVGPMITTGTGALAAIAGLALYFVAAGQVSAVDARYSRPGRHRLGPRAGRRPRRSRRRRLVAAPHGRRQDPVRPHRRRFGGLLTHGRHPGPRRPHAPTPRRPRPRVLDGGLRPRVHRHVRSWPPAPTRSARRRPRFR